MTSEEYKILEKQLQAELQQARCDKKEFEVVKCRRALDTLHDIGKAQNLI